MRLVVPIAKSGLSLISSFPDEEIVVAECSRGAPSEVEFWSRPRQHSYEEILLVERRASTGLTQRAVGEALSRQYGITGQLRFAAVDPETQIAFNHQHYLLAGQEIRPRPAQCPQALDHRYVIGLVGWPGVGKTLVRHLFSQLPGCSTHKWGAFAQRTIAEALYRDPTHAVTFADVWHYAQTEEQRDRTQIAKNFVQAVHNDASPFLVVDGIKTREQLLYIAYTLKWPIVLVHISRGEQERQCSIADRADADDLFDAQRLEMLQALGTSQLIKMADFAVPTDGCMTHYETNRCQVLFTQAFLEGMHSLLSWLFLSGSQGESLQLITRAAGQVAKQRGFSAHVEVR